VFRKFRIINLSKPSDNDVTHAVTLHTSHFATVYLRTPWNTNLPKHDKPIGL